MLFLQGPISLNKQRVPKRLINPVTRLKTNFLNPPYTSRRSSLGLLQTDIYASLILGALVEDGGNVNKCTWQGPRNYDSIFCYHEIKEFSLFLPDRFFLKQHFPDLTS